MTQFIIREDSSAECPLCTSLLIKVTHKHQLAVTATHPQSQCAWSGLKFRLHPVTGYAERIKEAA
jgi:hypothetical protein